MSTESVRIIRISGRPDINVPPGYETRYREVIEALNMGIDLDDFNSNIQDGVLTLTRPSGKKGNDFIVDGDVVYPKPAEGGAFPTLADIKVLTVEFPNDNLFETLKDPVKIQEYITFLGSEEYAARKIEEAAEAATAKVVEDINAFGEHAVKVAKLLNAFPAELKVAEAKTAAKLKSQLEVTQALLETAYFAHQDAARDAIEAQASEESIAAERKAALDAIYG